MASLRSLPVHWSRDTFATCIPVTILPSWHHITVVSKLWGCFLKGRLFFLLEWLGYKASAVLGKEDDGYASKRTWGLLQKSVTVSQNQLMKWTSWVSSARGRCLAKSPFEKNCLLLQKQKVTVLELIGQRVAAWHSSSCAPLCLGTLPLSLPTSSTGCRAGCFLWRKPEQDLACWELSPAPPSVSLLWISCKWSHNWTSKPITHVCWFWYSHALQRRL